MRILFTQIWSDRSHKSFIRFIEIRFEQNLKQWYAVGYAGIYAQRYIPCKIYNLKSIHESDNPVCQKLERCSFVNINYGALQVIGSPILSILPMKRTRQILMASEYWKSEFSIIISAIEMNKALLKAWTYMSRNIIHMLRSFSRGMLRAYDNASKQR